jgi:hypothetical protein
MSYMHVVYRNGGRDVTAAEGTFTHTQGSKGCIRGKREETRGIGYNTPPPQRRSVSSNKETACLALN